MANGVSMLRMAGVSTRIKHQVIDILAPGKRTSVMVMAAKLLLPLYMKEILLEIKKMGSAY